MLSPKPEDYVVKVPIGRRPVADLKCPYCEKSGGVRVCAYKRVDRETSETWATVECVCVESIQSYPEIFEIGRTIYADVQKALQEPKTTARRQIVWQLEYDDAEKARALEASKPRPRRQNEWDAYEDFGLPEDFHTANIPKEAGPFVVRQGGSYQADRSPVLMIFSLKEDDDPSPWAQATVCVAGAPAPEPPHGHVWLKGWSENEGLPEALVAAGAVSEAIDEREIGMATTTLHKILMKPKVA